MNCSDHAPLVENKVSIYLSSLIFSLQCKVSVKEEHGQETLSMDVGCNGSLFDV
jgi:hypothetical protein